jgi:hypothetical protein
MYRFTEQWRTRIGRFGRLHRNQIDNSTRYEHSPPHLPQRTCVCDWHFKQHILPPTNGHGRRIQLSFRDCIGPCTWFSLILFPIHPTLLHTLSLGTTPRVQTRSYNTACRVTLLIPNLDHTVTTHLRTVHIPVPRLCAAKSPDFSTWRRFICVTGSQLVAAAPHHLKVHTVIVKVLFW